MLGERDDVIARHLLHVDVAATVLAQLGSRGDQVALTAIGSCVQAAPRRLGYSEPTLILGGMRGLDRVRDRPALDRVVLLLDRVPVAPRDVELVADEVAV